ncbi:HTH-type transcriptional regulator Hpr [Neobacillus cucumis]|uniref:HTH-type transcriptional regulator Hpr n=1 Tax=Neobacillus cucumis TaxID=1740721 RepID=UPI002E226E14|nr:HTH-type transcriptional regulator Hpr [Neobacillus cucumis]
MSGSINDYTIMESLFFTQRMMQLSKALWKVIEKDWQQWIKPYDLNINEHHILWITYYLKDAPISEIAKLGVMHVSTAFNFSKKLENQGYLQFSKKENDMRNTYIQLTKKGEELLLTIFKNYEPLQNSVFKGALPLHELYGKFPEFIEMSAIVRSIYGDDFMEVFEYSFDNIEKDSLNWKE